MTGPILAGGQIAHGEDAVIWTQTFLRIKVELLKMTWQVKAKEVIIVILIMLLKLKGLTKPR